MYKKITFLFIILNLGCNIINPDETIPSYLKINSFNLNTDSINEGSNSNNITDVWVYLNGQLQGVYELPVEFPILEQGNFNFSLGAGIQMNGISATRIEYPFYENYSTNTTIFEDSTIQIYPSTQYYPEITFEWIEDFDQPGMSMVTTLLSDTILFRVISPTLTFGGYGGSAVAYLDSNRSIFECESNQQFELPLWGTPVFLELDYKTSEILFVGIKANNSSSTVQKTILGINPSEEWKKIYINLTNAILEEPNAINFNIFLGAGLSSTNTSAEIFFDNIKLIY